MNPLRRAHNKFVKIITYPSIVQKPHKKHKHGINLTCLWKSHQFFVDFKEETKRCTRCGRLEKL